MKQEKVYIYGKHALKEELFFSPEVVDRVFLPERQDDKKLASQCFRHWLYGIIAL